MAGVNETPLPGVGVRYEFEVSDGRRVAVIHHRTGQRELVILDTDRPDAVPDVVRLSEDDSRTLVEVLGGSSVVRDLSRLQQSVEGLAIDWLSLPSSSRFAGRTIGHTEARTRTGVSVVAVIRGKMAYPAPGPDFGLDAGDTLVVVGTPVGIRDLVEILRTG